MRNVFICLFFLCAFGFNQNVHAQFSQRQGNPELPQYPVQPSPKLAGTKLYTYSLSGNPQGQTQAAQEILSQPSNFDYHQMVVGLVRLRGDQSVRNGTAKLYRLGPDAQGRVTLLEQKVGLLLQPNQSLSPRPAANLTFAVVPFGMENVSNLQPQAAPLIVSITATTVGTQTLELGLADGTGQILDGRRLSLVQVTGPEGMENPVPSFPNGGYTSLTVALPPIGWRTDQPQFTNLNGGSLFSPPVLPPIQPIPEPCSNPTQPKTGTQMPIQQYLTTNGVILPPYTPPPTAGERSGLKSLPTIPNQVLVQTVGKDVERKNHRP